MKKVSCIVVGTGGFARHHIQIMLDLKRSTEIVGLVEPLESSRTSTAELFSARSQLCPPFYTTIQELIRGQGSADAALICTPHKFHFENAVDCLNNNMDLLIEKPMVMNEQEARRLMALRNQTGRLVMVAFPGSLSPAIWKAKELLKKGVIGNISAISAFAQQDWKTITEGTWRQIPEISGGGFLFDTGSHMVNTVVDLMDGDVACVSALFDFRDTAVEINSSVSGMTTNGIIFSLAGAGDSANISSQILVFGDRGILKTGIWGEFLTVKKAKDLDFQAVPYRESKGPWEQFLRVRSGKMENPCPPEVGLRFARLMDMIRHSAESGQTVLKSN